MPLKDPKIIPIPKDIVKKVGKIKNLFDIPGFVLSLKWILSKYTKEMMK